MSALVLALVCPARFITVHTRTTRITTDQGMVTMAIIVRTTGTGATVITMDTIAGITGN